MIIILRRGRTNPGIKSARRPERTTPATVSEDSITAALRGRLLWRRLVLGRRRRLRRLLLPDHPRTRLDAKLDELLVGVPEAPAQVSLNSPARDLAQPLELLPAADKV